MGNLDERKKILIVDDEKIQLSIVEEILSSEFNVVSAESGKIALEIISNGYLPDLILLDIIMPEMNGFELYNNIREINNFENIPILFLTSVTEGVEIKRAKDIGAADYIMKPIKNSVLLNRVKNVISAYDYLKQAKNRMK